MEGQVIKSLNSFLFDLTGKYCFFKTEVCSHTMRASLVAQLVKNSPARQETLVQFMGWKDPLEKGLANHSRILGLLRW